MNLSCSSRAIKYLMFIFNFFFVITGIALIAVGATIKSNYKQYDTFLDSQYFSLPNLLIATGVIIFFISFLGCYGAIKESWIILLAFSVLLGIVFIFEFSAGIAGYVLRDRTSNYLEKTFYNSMREYKNSTSIAKMWDVIQTEFQCCGVYSSDDWNNTISNDALPISCCPSQYGTVGDFHCNNVKTTSVAPTTPTMLSPAVAPKSINIDPSPITPANGTSDSISRKKRLAEDENGNSTAIPISTTTPYDQGCEKAFGDYVKTHAVEIGAVGFALAIIQIVGIAFSCHLARQLKNQYYST